RVFMLLDQTPEIAESPQALPLLRAEGNFEFRDVHFQYGEGPRGLRNISFRVPAGARVGIVGSTGAGKTTLLNLLMRFYDPTRGNAAHSFLAASASVFPWPALSCEIALSLFWMSRPVLWICRRKPPSCGPRRN